MPKRTDINTIMLIGAGPIIIGQACEFDYSGTQACKALKEEGYRVILVNSNPATIMTDPDLADATYIEPITPEMVAHIIKIERPDAILPTMGGQTALNTVIALAKNGILDQYNVSLIGANISAIYKAEDRLLFKKTMKKIGLESARSKIVRSLEEALKHIDYIGLPCIMRPSFTLGGTGGGVAYNKEEFVNIVINGLEASPTTEVLIEESIIGWKEYEMEVIRDKKDNCIIICSIENVDPMGVHTGDSITVAPALTLSDREYQIMRNASIAVLREIGIETGGSNVQFAVHPHTGRLIIVEMNPRVSRSSALASKATGFPIAKIATKLAIGYTLDALDNDITGITPASFEPSIDYIVTKMPRFTFEKFPRADNTLSTTMKSIGEAMAIGRNFQESLQKALCSLETGLTGLNEQFPPQQTSSESIVENIRNRLSTPTPERLLHIADALRHGIIEEEIATLSGFNPWFIEQIKGIIDMEKKIRHEGLPTDTHHFHRLKQMGFSDARLAELTQEKEETIRMKRHEHHIYPYFRLIDTCAAEFPSQTPYFYSSYDSPSPFDNQQEANPSHHKKVIILGGGPNRIGQGIEFDYCCCHAAYALSELDIESIIINCNPETVSTDYDTSDRLYFEPLTEEHVLEILSCEQKKGSLLGVIVQLGGQTPLKLSKAIEKARIPILGTSPDTIDLAEDRDRFKNLIDTLNLQQPPNGIAKNKQEALDIADKIGYPIVVRPSYVLGGRAMEIIQEATQLTEYMEKHIINDAPLLIDFYLRDAIEIDVDVLCDGSDVFIAGILEHIEEAGVHSGDSACSMPPHSLSEPIIEALERQATKMALALNIIGLMNIQFALQNGKLYVLEVNPRASRTVPFVSKVLGQPLANIATQIMVGRKLSTFNLQKQKNKHVAVKEVVFPFTRFPGVDTVLGPEMRSTGEVMGIDKDFATAFAKSQLAAGTILPHSGTVFISVRDIDKARVLKSAQQLSHIGFTIMATRGTAHYLTENNVTTTAVNKVREGQPHILDAIKNGNIQLLINTTEGTKSISDSKSLRQTALMHKIPYFTTLAGAEAAISAIKTTRKTPLTPRSLQEYAKK